MVISAVEHPQVHKMGSHVGEQPGMHELFWIGGGKSPL